MHYHQPVEFFYTQLSIPQVQAYADLLQNHFTAQQDAMENARRKQQMGIGGANKSAKYN